MTQDQITLEDARAAGDAAIAQVAENAGETFMDRARLYVLALLRFGPYSGEELTECCKEAGIVPVNGDRAFGAVYAQLARQGFIEKAGYCPRAKGHGTSGGIVWRLKQ